MATHTLFKRLKSRLDALDDTAVSNLTYQLTQDGVTLSEIQDWMKLHCPRAYCFALTMDEARRYKLNGVNWSVVDAAASWDPITRRTTPFFVSIHVLRDYTHLAETLVSFNLTDAQNQQRLDHCGFLTLFERS